METVRTIAILVGGAICTFVPILLFVIWYMGKKSEIANAQTMWANVVQRLGGRLLPQRGVGNTQAFAVDDALLSMVTYAMVDSPISGELRPIAAANAWQTQLTVPVRRELPPFELCVASCGFGAGAPTGNAAFDADWKVFPLQGAHPAHAPALLQMDVLEALGALRGGKYQIYTGGSNVCGLCPDAIQSEQQLEALIFVCRRLAGAI